jgi:carboxymethylenebutenolidase
MSDLNPDQQYFVEEFYEDYREGLLSRREFIKKLAYVVGSMAATATLMSQLGCSTDELPDATEPMPTPATAKPTTNASTAALVPVPGAQSPLSQPEGAPGMTTGVVTFASDDTEINGYLARPTDSGPHPAILVCHENRGLNDHIRDVARRFAHEGYVALAVDLLSREGGAAAQDAAQIPGLLGAPGPERHVADFRAALDYLQTLDDVASDRVGMTGYCFGGGITWDTAIAEPRLKAAVPFYGRAPELANVAAIQAAVLAIYAEQDSRINAGIPALEEALVAAGVTYQVNIYPGVDHAFHNDTGGRYVEAQATQAWQDTLEWFGTYL